MTDPNDWFDDDSLDNEGAGVAISKADLRERGYTEAQIRDIEHPRDPATGRFIPRTYEVVE